MMTKTRLIIGTGLIFIAGLLVGLFVTNKRDKGRYQGITQEGGTKILDTETGVTYNAYQDFDDECYYFIKLDLVGQKVEIRKVENPQIRENKSINQEPADIIEEMAPATNKGKN